MGVFITSSASTLFSHEKLVAIVSCELSAEIIPKFYQTRCIANTQRGWKVTYLENELWFSEQNKMCSLRNNLVFTDIYDIISHLCKFQHVQTQTGSFVMKSHDEKNIQKLETHTVRDGIAKSNKQNENEKSIVP